MKILVTGATGFIGGYVVRNLLACGHDVVATSAHEQIAAEKNWYPLVTYRPHKIGSVLPENLARYFEMPDAVVHLAWDGLPNYNSLHHIENNLPAHYFFLKALALQGAKNISVAGTCYEYGMQTGCLEETQMVEPANSYAVAKDSLRRFLTELAKQHSFSLKWLRLFYMYGKDQAPNSLIPQLHLAVSQGQKSFNMSPGDQVRDFLPVEKVAEYICTAALQNKVSGIINVCSGNPVQVKDFVKEYMLQHDINIELNTGYYPYNPLEPFAFWGNRDKLNKVLDATSV